MNKTTVVNKYKEKYDIYIGRGSKWGNPFPITERNDRDSVIKAHKIYINSLIEQGTLKEEDFKELQGKKLGCFCKPKGCHGDYLAQIADAGWEDGKPCLD